MPTTTQPQAAASAARNSQPTVPFPQASRRAREQPLSFQITPGAAGITIGPSDLTPNGFLRYVDIHVSTVTAATGSPVFAAGGPHNIFDNLQFIDTGGQKMDDLPGFALLCDNIIGGLRHASDPRTAYDYSNSATSPNFRLRLERELFPDGRGSLPNLSGSQKYRVRLHVDTLSDIYSTTPTAAPTLQIDVIDHLWLLPAAYDGGQRPQQRQPSLLGLAQYRTSWYPSISINSQNVDEEIKAKGNLIKYIALLGQNNAGAYSDAVFPDPFTLRLDNSYPCDNVPLAEIIDEGQSFLGPNAGRITGLVFFPFDYGRGRVVGAEGVSSWLPTSTATYIEYKGKQPAATTGTISVLVCEISDAEVDPAERAALGSQTGTWNPQIAPTVAGGV